MALPDPIHDASLIECPHLPAVERPLRASGMRRFGKMDRGAEFYLAALETAQSLWLQGLPAQALLQINRAMGADLAGDQPVLRECPMPYAAAAWIMRQRVDSQFIGNPRRHYQHLATRMVAPRRELRTWRAWACWALACHIFSEMPADQEQIDREGVEEPDVAQIACRLNELAGSVEERLWLEVYSELSAES